MPESVQQPAGSAGERLQPTQFVWRVLRAVMAAPESLLDMPARELDMALRLLRRAQLLGRAAAALEQGGPDLIDRLPHPAPDILRSALVSARARERVARWELDRLAWALESIDGPVVALKGCAYLLAGTPNAAGRSFADVDLLLPREILPTAEAALLARGWQASELSPYDDRYYRHWAHELPPMRHREREVEIDLHHTIVMPTGRLKPDPARILDSIRPVPGQRFSVLAPADMVLHSATHLFFGEMDGGLRDLVDIAELLRHFGDTEPGFWEGFWPRAEVLGLSRPASHAIRQAQALLGLQVPGFVAEAAERAATPAPLRHVFDSLVRLALPPQHPERALRRVGLSRQLMLARAHWLRMPPWMLARHLGFKAWLRLRPARADASAKAEGR
jgi:hypothetical protein